MCYIRVRALATREVLSAAENRQTVTRRAVAARDSVVAFAWPLRRVECPERREGNDLRKQDLAVRKVGCGAVPAWSAAKSRGEDSVANQRGVSY